MNRNEFEKRFNAAYAKALDADFIESVTKKISESNDREAAMIKAFLEIHENVLRTELEEFLVDAEA